MTYAAGDPTSTIESVVELAVDARVTEFFSDGSSVVNFLTLRANLRGVGLSDAVSFVDAPEAGREGEVLRIPVERFASPCCDAVEALDITVNVLPSETVIDGVDIDFPEGRVLSWGAGESGVRTLAVALLADGTRPDEEGDESFVVFIEASSLATVGVRIGRVGVALLDVPVPITSGSVRFTSRSISIGGQTMEAAVAVERVGGSDGPLTVAVMSRDGTAVAGEDFEQVTTALSWEDGESGVRTFPLVITPDDSGRETPESFELILDVPRDGSGEPVDEAPETERVLQVVLTDTVDPADGLQVRIVAGDEQGGLPGDTLDPLVVEVLDLFDGGGPTTLAEVVWRAEPEGSAEFIGGNRSFGDDDGRYAKQVIIRERGFLRVFARAERLGDGSTAGPRGDATLADDTRGLTPRIDPPPLPAVANNETIFVVRAGFQPATDLTPNQSEAGRALDNACEALETSGRELTDAQQDLRRTCGDLGSHLDSGSLGVALDRLLPEEAFVLGDASVDAADLQITNVYGRITALRQGTINGFDVAGLTLNYRDQSVPGRVLESARRALTSRGGGASADDIARGPSIGVFVNGTVSVGEFDAAGNQRDTEFSTAGLTVGVDYRLSNRLVLGASLGYVGNETDFRADGDSASITGLSVALYGTWFERDSGYVDAVIDIGRNDYTIRRRIDPLVPPGDDEGFPDLFATGETDAMALALRVSAARTFQRANWEFGPYIRMMLAQAEVSGYSENAESDTRGFGSVLRLGDHSVSSTRLSIGAETTATYGTASAIFQPRVRLEGEFENVEEKDALVATFQHDPTSTSFSIEGDRRDTQAVNLGIGTSVVLRGGRSGYVFYETKLAHDYITQHWLKLGLRLDF